MAVTGRAGLLALALTVAVLVASAPGAVLAVVDGALLLAVLADVLLAPSPRQLEFRRDCPAAGRLGEPTPARLIVANTGTRKVHARIRDAWPPSAGLAPPSTDATDPGRRAAQLRPAAGADAPRRPDAGRS